MLNWPAYALVSISLLSCGSLPPKERVCSPDHPCIGCVLPTMNQQSHVEGKLLPSIVRVIGQTSPEDGERWKVLKDGEQNPSRWVPMDQETVRFGAVCGMEARSFEDIFQRQEPPR